MTGKNVYGILVKGIPEVFVLFLHSCKKESHVEQEVIRPLVRLTTSDIPVLEGAEQLEYGEAPWQFNEWNHHIITQYQFLWENSARVEIFEYVTTGQDEAEQFLLSLHETYSDPLIDNSRDDPPVAGDISYSGGQEFIRDNLIVRINPEGNYEALISQIACEVDAVILLSNEYTRADQLIPIINMFALKRNPVKRESITPFIVDVINPDSTLPTYGLRISPNSGAGRFLKDECGNYYYYAYYPQYDIPDITLNLKTYNEYGFCADSTIDIIAEQWNSHDEAPWDEDLLGPDFESALLGRWQSVFDDDHLDTIVTYLEFREEGIAAISLKGDCRETDFEGTYTVSYLRPPAYGYVTRAIITINTTTGDIVLKDVSFCENNGLPYENNFLRIFNSPYGTLDKMN